MQILVMHITLISWRCLFCRWQKKNGWGYVPLVKHDWAWIPHAVFSGV